MRIFNHVMTPLFSGALAICSFSAISASVTPVFSPSTIGANSNSQLTLTLSNSSGTNERELSFTADLPANVSLATPVISSHTCGANAILTAVDGASSFSLANGTLANGESCQVTVMASSNTLGTHTLTLPSIDIGSVTVPGDSTDLTIADDRPSVSFSFDTATAVVGENIRATLTFDNSAVASGYQSLSASFQLPDGLSVSDFPDTSNDCGGSSSTLESSTFSIAAGAVTAGGTCSISQNLKASKPVSGIIASAGITGQKLASPFPLNELGYAADDIVISQPALIMNVAAPVSPGQSSQLSFTLTNFERAQSASDIDFTVDLSAITPSAIPGITWSAANLSNVCNSSGNLSGSGSNTITFSNGSLAAEESCTFSVDINIPASSAAGSYEITSSTVMVDGIGKGTAKAALVVVGAPLASLRFTQGGDEVTSVTAGDTVGVEFTFTDTSGSTVTNLAASLELTGELPFPISAILPPDPDPACGVGSTVILNYLDADSQALVLSGGSLAANSSCTFTVDIVLPTGLASGTLNYTLDSASATVNSTTVYPNLPSFSLDVVSAPSLSVVMPKGVQANDTDNVVFTLSSSVASPTDATNITFTLDLDSVLTGLVATGLPLNDSCGIGSSVSGTSTITFSGGILSPGAECSFSVPVIIPDPVTPGSYSASTSAITATVSGLATTGLAGSDSLVVTGLEGSLEFLTSVMPGGQVTARYTFNNVGPDDLTNLNFSHFLNNTLSSLNYSGGNLIDVCGTGSTLSGTSSLSIAGGNLLAGESCSFNLDLDVPVGATENTYSSVTSGVSYQIAGPTNLAFDALSAVLTVEQPIVASAAFNDVSANDQTTATLIYTLTNNGADAVTSIAFTDDYDTSLSGAAANISNASQCNGSLSGTSVLSFSGGSIASGETCTITVGIDLPDVDSQTIFQTTSSSITATSNALAVNVDAVSADIAVLNSALEVVVSVGTPSASLVSDGSITFPVTITNADDINLLATDVLVSKSGTADATVSISAGTTASPVVTLSSITGDGSLAVSLDAGIARNDSGASIATTVSDSVVVDNTKPLITLSSTQDGNTLNNLTPFVVNVVFAEDKDGLSVSKSDLVLVNATASDFSISDGNSTTTTITPLADGAVTVTLAADTIVDTANNGNVQQSVGFTYDNTKPTLAISAPSENVNSAFTASFTFSENVTGFDATDIVVSNASLSSFSGSAANYSVLVTPTTDGDVTLDVAADVAVDSAVNGNAVATQLTVKYDTTQPTVTILPPAGKQNSNFTIQVQFNETVSGFELSDIITNNAVLSNLVDIGGGNYTVLVSPNGDGQLTFDIAAGVAADAAGNLNSVASQEIIDFDASAPEVTISAGSLHQNSAFTANIDFTENVSGFDINDIQATNANLSDFAGTDANYTVLVAPTTDGQVLLDIAAAIAVDEAGNDNNAATQFIAVYDTQLPTVSINAPTTPQNSAFTVNINFNEDVTGFDVTDIGVTNAVLSNFSGANASYSVLVTPDGNADITLSIEAGVAQDAANNNNTAAQPSSVQFDDSAPSTTISMPSGTQTASFTATITFGEAVTGFAQSDIVATNATLSGFAGTGASYTVTVTPTSDGEVTLNVGAGVAQDSAGNENTAAQAATVTFDGSAPTTTILLPSGIQTAAFTATITFGESVLGFTQSDIVATNATLSGFAGTGASYSVTVTPTSDGDVTLNVAAGVAQDSAGNYNTAAQTARAQFDGSAPIAELSTASQIVNNSFEVMVEFSEVITGLDVNDFVLENATVSSITAITSTSYKILIQPIINGTVSVSLASGAVKDSAGNINKESNKLVVEFNNELVSINILVPEKAKDKFTAKFEFSNVVTGFDITDIKVINATLNNFVASSSTVYKVDVVGLSVGEITLNIPENVVLDQYGNGNVASPIVKIEFDNQAPKPQSLVPTNNSEFVSTETLFSISFNESVSLGNGQIRLLDTNDGTEVVTVNKNVSGNILSFVFESALRVNTKYQITVEKGAVIDMFENQSAQISDWTFTTSNEAPVANDDMAATDEDMAVSISITANDSDNENELDLMSIELSQADHGTVQHIGDGVIEYTPNQDYNGTDSFTYTIADAAGLRSNQATVSVDIKSVNDAPIFVSEPNLSANALVEYIYNIETTDIDSEDLIITAPNNDLPEWLNLEGVKLVGTPPISASGEEFSIQLKVSDGELTDSQSFTLKVVEFDDTLITISQEASVSPILIEQAFDLTVKIGNETNQAVSLDALSIALSGADVLASPQNCDLVGQAFECQPTLSLSSMDSFELTFRLLANVAGDFKSNVSLTVNEEISKQDLFAKNISESASNEPGEQLPISEANSLDFADFNNDGLIDILFAANQKSALFINSGLGAFELATSILSSENVLDFAVADFNNDGLVDIAYATEGSNGSGILYNLGDATFSNAQIISTRASKKVFAFDINADLQADIVYLDDSLFGISIFTQPFDEFWQMHTQLANTESNAGKFEFNDLAYGDINSDGLVDLALAVENSALEIWYQNSNGEYSKQQTEIFDANNVMLADISNSGELDVIALLNEGVAVINTQSSAVNFISSVSYQEIGIANLQGDAELEIALLSDAGDIIIFSLSEGNYEQLPTVFETDDANDFVLTDVDMDGDIDIVTSSLAGGNEIRFNQGNGLFGQQTTDLSLTFSETSSTLTVGESATFDVMLENNGLAKASNPILLISTDNASIESVNSDKFSCVSESRGYLCEYSGDIEVGEQVIVSNSVVFNTIGTALINAEVANERVDDDLTNNTDQVSVNVVAKPVVVIPEKKKSSGNLFYLLLLVLLIALMRNKKAIVYIKRFN